MQPWIDLATASVSAVWRFNCQILQLNSKLLANMGMMLGKMAEQCECAAPCPPCPPKPHVDDKDEPCEPKGKR